MAQRKVFELQFTLVLSIKISWSLNTFCIKGHPSFKHRLKKGILPAYKNRLFICFTFKAASLLRTESNAIGSLDKFLNGPVLSPSEAIINIYVLEIVEA